MARTRAAAPVVPETAKAAKTAAVARVIARRRPTRYAELADPRTGGVFRWAMDSGGGEFTEPQNLDEYIDDTLARCAVAEGAPDTIIAMLELLRGGPDAVPGAVALAADLPPWGQFACWMVMGGLPGGPAPVDQVKARIMREWKARRLQVTPPPAGWFEPTERDRLPARPPVRYRSELGHPAGMTL